MWEHEHRAYGCLCTFQLAILKCITCFYSTHTYKHLLDHKWTHIHPSHTFTLVYSTSGPCLHCKCFVFALYIHKLVQPLNVYKVLCIKFYIYILLTIMAKLYSLFCALQGCHHIREKELFIMYRSILPFLHKIFLYHIINKV